MKTGRWSGRTYLFLLLAGVVVGCDRTDRSGEGEPVTFPLAEAERTVLAYVVGDNGSNELTPYLLANIRDMEKGMASVDPERFNLLVYSEMAGDLPHLVYLHRNASGTVVRDTVFSYPEQNPLDKEVMAAVFRTVVTNFPARSYGMAFLSHCASWLPAAKDANAGPQKSVGAYRMTQMNVADFGETIRQAFPELLDFLFFDACLMLSAEVAYELCPCTRTLVGSPAEIPGPGAPYETVVPAFFQLQNPAEAVAAAYFEPYGQMYGQSGVSWSDGVAVGVIDCTQMEELAAVSRMMLEKYRDGYELDRASLLAYDYAATDANRDLEDLMAMVMGGRESDDYKNWRAVLDRALPYWKTTPRIYSMMAGSVSMAGADGMACYVPWGNPDTEQNVFYRTLQWYDAAGWNLIPY